MVAPEEVVERVVRGDRLAGDREDRPQAEDQQADDESWLPEQDRAALATRLSALGTDVGGWGRDCHQWVSSLTRGFIQAMIRSAANVATMYTMPITMTPAVRTGMSLRWAANSIIWPMPL